jgi:uncharacterized DUF497 family protein
MAALFDWDPAKDEENQRKHGVAFREAQFAFLDPYCVIARDTEHSIGEERFFCFGRVAGHVLTVRFIYRSGIVRIFGAGYWRRGRKAYEAIQGIH